MTITAGREALQLPKDTIIFRQGDPGDEMFVISAGRVRLTLGDQGLERQVAVLGPGDFFGELSLLSGATRSATAQTVEDSNLLVISRDVFSMMMQDDLDVVFRMMHAQGRRLSQTNQPIEQLMQQLGRLRIVTECLRRFVNARQGLCTIDINVLAEDVGVSPTEVAATMTTLVQRGAGVLHGQQWQIEGQQQLQRLVEILSTYATVRTP